MNIQKECEEILRSLIAKHGFLQPDNPMFDVWNSSDAKEVVADLIEAIQGSYEIENAHKKDDWGK